MRPSTRRIISTIQLEAPAFFPVLILILAQSVVLASETSGWIAAALSPLCFLFLPARRVVPLYGFGLFIALLASGVSSTRAPDGEMRVLLRVLEEPRYPRAGEVSFIASVIPVTTEEKAGRGPSKVLCRSALLPWRNIHRISDGSVAVALAKFSPLKPKSSYNRMLLRRGVRSSCKLKLVSGWDDSRRKIWSHLRESVRTTVFSLDVSESAAELFLSMTFGVRDRLPRSFERGFKRTGLAHVLVVSGYQVTLLYFLLLQFLKAVSFFFLGATARVHCIALYPLIALVLCFIFVAIACFDPAAFRALVAILMVAIASSMERKINYLQIGSVSLLLLIIIWPGCHLEPSVQLTYSALIGLGLGSALASSAAGKYLMASTLASVGASSVAALWFGNFALVGLLLNPLLAPLVSLLSCKFGGGLLALYSMGFNPAKPLLEILLMFLRWIADLLVWLSDFGGNYLCFEGDTALVAACCGLGVVLWAIRMTFVRWIALRNLSDPGRRDA